MSPSLEAFFNADAVSAARRLIGSELLYEGVGGRIVETEAYDRTDPAAHTYRGQTARNAVMFGPVGRAYVYRIYGAHWCLNLVCGPEPGQAVLIRALEPLHGLERMAERRGLTESKRLCSGPGRLCQALSITGAQNGAPLDRPPFCLELAGSPGQVLQGRRIGLAKGVETPWRFGLAGSPYLSRPFRDAA